MLGTQAGSLKKVAHIYNLVIMMMMIMIMIITLVTELLPFRPPGLRSTPQVDNVAILFR